MEFAYVQIYVILIIVTCSLLVGVDFVANKPKLEAKLNEKHALLYREQQKSHLFLGFWDLKIFQGSMPPNPLRLIVMMIVMMLTTGLLLLLFVLLLV